MTGQADTRIKTILTADSGDFEAGFQRAITVSNAAKGKFLQNNKVIEGSFKDISKSVSGFGAAFGISLGVGALIGFGRQVLHVADALKTIEDRTGVSASVLRSFQADVENSGGSLDDLGNALQKMQIKLGQALGGSKSAAQAFDSIGLSIAQLQALEPQKRFEAVATAISNIKDPAQRAAAAFTVFGKGAAPLLPFLEDFARRAAETKGFVDQLTATMDSDAINILDNFGDQINTLTIRLTNLAATGLSNVIGTLKSLKLQVAQISILAQKSAGLIDPEVADDALKEVGGQIDEKFHPKPKDKSPAAGSFTDPSALSDGASKAESFGKAFKKMQQEVNKGIAVSGLSDLDAKVLEAKINVEDLADRYGQKLTPALKETEAAYLDQIRVQYKLNLEQKRTNELADSLGDSFSNAFDEATDGAHKFSDVLSDLGNSIEKALFKNVVGDPLNQLISSFTKSALSGSGGSGGGIAGIFSSLYAALPSFSFATGVSNVPYDMNARIHKGESVLSAQETKNMGGGGDIVVNVINNAGAKVGTSQKQNGNGTELTVMIDQAVAKNIANRNSATSQAMAAVDSRALTRR